MEGFEERRGVMKTVCPNVSLATMGKFIWSR